MRVLLSDRQGSCRANRFEAAVRLAATATTPSRPFCMGNVNDVQIAFNNEEDCRIPSQAFRRCAQRRFAFVEAAGRALRPLPTVIIHLAHLNSATCHPAHPQPPCTETANESRASLLLAGREGRHIYMLLLSTNTKTRSRGRIIITGGGGGGRRVKKKSRREQKRTQHEERECVCMKRPRN